MVTGEPTRKEFIMKLGNVSYSQVQGNGKSDLKAKIARNVVAIANEKGLAVITNNADYTQWYQCESIVDASLEALVDLLNTVPENTTELLAKPYRVVLPRAISGLATGSFIDYIRTGKSVTSGEVIPQARLEMYALVMKLMSTRYANIELVADGHASKFDKEVRDSAWKMVKAEVSARVHGSSTAVQSAPASQANNMLADKLAEIECQIVDAMIAGDEELMARLESAKARLSAMVKQEEQQPAEEVQVAEDVKGLF